MPKIEYDNHYLVTYVGGKETILHGENLEQVAKEAEYQTFKAPRIVQSIVLLRILRMPTKKGDAFVQMWVNEDHLDKVKTLPRQINV